MKTPPVRVVKPSPYRRIEELVFSSVLGSKVNDRTEPYIEVLLHLHPELGDLFNGGNGKKCPICGREFKRLLPHLTNSSTCREALGIYVSQAVETAKAAEQHIYILRIRNGGERKRVYRCRICREKFESKGEALLHVLREHPESL